MHLNKLMFRGDTKGDTGLLGHTVYIQTNIICIYCMI